MSGGSSAESFGGFLRERRVAGGFTLRKFASELELSPTYVSGVENGTLPPPTPERLRSIAGLLGIEEDALIDLAQRWDDAFSMEAKEKPKLVSVYRAVRDLSPDQMDQVVRFAQGLDKEDERA